MKEVSKEPLLSIILPVYNGEQYIEKCIKQITEQNYKNFELIIVNDGSNDNTLKLINKYIKQDKRIVLIDKKNTGVSNSRNIGIMKAKGNYIAFVDVDDIIDPTIYEKMIKKLELSNADVCVCNYKEYFLNKNKYVPSKYALKNEIISKETAIRNYLLDKIGPAIWDKTYKSNIVKNTRFEESLNIGEDILYCLNILFKTNKVATIEDELYYYVQQDKSVMHKINEKYLQFKKVTGLINKKDQEYLKTNFKKEFDFFKLEMITRGIHSISTNYNKENKKDAIRLLKEYVNSKDLTKIINSEYFGKSVKIEMIMLKSFGIKFHLRTTKLYKIMRNIIRKM